MTEAILIRSCYQRHGGIRSELNSATLTVSLAARQLAAAARTRRATPAPAGARCGPRYSSRMAVTAS